MVTAIILAAGSGKRLGAGIPKQYMEIAGKPLLYYSLKAFEQSRADKIIIVARAGDEAYIKDSIVDKFGFNKVKRIVKGGAQRFDSVLAGLRACKGEGAERESGGLSDDYVLIHDGARPFITPDDIEQVANEAVKYSAAIAAARSADTVKLATDEGFISSEPLRRLTWRAETPQAFKAEFIINAYEKVVGTPFENGGASPEERGALTDDAQVFSAAYPEIPVKLVDIGPGNFKITTKKDLLLAEALLERLG